MSTLTWVPSELEDCLVELFSFGELFVEQSVDLIIEVEGGVEQFVVAVQVDCDFDACPFFDKGFHRCCLGLRKGARSTIVIIASVVVTRGAYIVICKFEGVVPIQVDSNA